MFPSYVDLKSPTTSVFTISPQSALAQGRVYKDTEKFPLTQAQEVLETHAKKITKSHTQYNPNNESQAYGREAS